MNDSKGYKYIPPDLPKMFLDLLEPVKGLKPQKLEYTCTICNMRLATLSSLVTHNKCHERPVCLDCFKRLPSASCLAKHRSEECGFDNEENESVSTVQLTSKYGRSRNVTRHWEN